MNRRDFVSRAVLAAAVSGVSGRVFAQSRETEKSVSEVADDVLARLEILKARTSVMQGYLSEAVPGISVAAIVDGRVVWSAGYGVRKIGRK